MLSKCKTAVRMLARGDPGGFARQLGLNLRRMRVALGRGRPFVHGRLGFRFPCFPDAHDSVELYLRESPDATELSLVRAWIEPGDAAVDVGSNLGIYAVAAAQAVRGRGRILAVEPSPDLRERLQRTVARLGLDCVCICGVCAGEAAGTTEFFVADGTGSTGEQSRRIDSGDRARYRRITVELDTLDRLVRAHDCGAAASFIKLDVEGAEVLALRGAGELLGSPDAALWLVEINRPALGRFGFGAADVLSHFPPERFENWLIPQFARERGRPAPPRPLDGAEPFDDAVFYNLAALPRGGRWAHRAGKVRKLLRPA